jgi:hypothetical protein
VVVVMMMEDHWKVNAMIEDRIYLIINFLIEYIYLHGSLKRKEIKKENKYT